MLQALPNKRLVVRGWPLRLKYVGGCVFLWHDEHAKSALLLVASISGYAMTCATAPRAILDDCEAIARVMLAYAARAEAEQWLPASVSQTLQASEKP